MFIIDPYADAKVLTDYGARARQRVGSALGRSSYGKSLKPASEHWAQQMK
ncbi:hypothetical protein AB7G19_16445 [Bradyrhizobium sp. 215_C5_N1_1]